MLILNQHKPLPPTGRLADTHRSVLVAHRLQHGLVEAELERRLVEHLALVGVARDEPVDLDVLLLPDAVTARLRLQVVLRVPVAVVDDDGVGGGEIDAEAAGARAQ